jgi:hypothetical protein
MEGSIPLGANSTPRGQSYLMRANFTPLGQSSPLGARLKTSLSVSRHPLLSKIIFL